MLDILFYLAGASLVTFLLAAATLFVCMVIIFIKEEFF